MPHIEDFAEFSIRMACPVRWAESRWVFKNGAQSDGHYGQSLPPEDKSDLTKLKHEIVTAEINYYRNRYSEVQKHVGIQSEYHMAGAGPSPDVTMPGWEKHLNEITMKISTLRGSATKLARQIKTNN